MTQHLRNKILAPLPDWHKNPLRLSLPEMENPYLVLEEFFECYSLTDLRVCLKEWLNEALRPGEVLAMDYNIICEQVERVIEAAWIIVGSRESGAGNPGLTSSSDPREWLKAT